MSNFFSTRFTTINDYLSTQHFAWKDLINLFHWSYWNEANILPTTPYFLVSWLFVIAAVVGLVIWRRRIKAANTVAPIYDGPINQLANIIAFIIIVALSYGFFRSQAISYLSSRLVVLASLLITLIWLGVVAFYMFRVAPAKSREYLERERFFRYIPKGKEKSPSKKKK